MRFATRVCRRSERRVTYRVTQPSGDLRSAAHGAPQNVTAFTAPSFALSSATREWGIRMGRGRRGFFDDLIKLPWPVALVVGVLAIRTRGIYFAMVTMALSQCVYYLFYQAIDLTGGENGLRGINVRTIDLLGLRIDFINPMIRYYVVAAFVIAAFFVMSHILASPFGAVIEAVRENEMRARASGYDVTLTRLLTFVLSGGLCGLAGALQALHLSIVPIEILHYETSGLVVMIALLGGMGTFFGPMIGAAVFLVLENIVSVWTVHWQLIVGAIFIACVLFFPAGIWGTLIARGRR